MRSENMQITEQQKQQLKVKVMQEMNKASMDYQTFDTEAEIDSSLTYAENYNLIMNKVEALLNSDPEHNLRKRATAYSQSIQLEQSMNYKNKEEWVKKTVNKSVVCCICGKRGGGKSALAFHYLELHHLLNPSRQCCVYKFPQPHLLPQWIININDMEECPKGAVMVIDEAGIEFNQFSFQKDESKGLSNFIKIARHNDISLFFITQNGGTLTKDIRRLIDFYLLREPSNSQLYDEISIIKRWYQNCFMLFSTPTAKQKGYFVADWELAEFMTFDLPTWWTEDISKAYSCSNQQQHFNTSSLLFKIGCVEVHKNR